MKTVNDWNEYEESAATIRATSYKELAEEAGRNELIRGVVAGQDVYAYVPDASDHPVVWVRQLVSVAKKLLSFSLLGSMVLLGGCDLGPGPAADPNGTPVAIHAQVQQRAPLYIMVSADITGSYPHSMTLAFLQQMAGWVETIPRVGSSPATVYFTYLSHAPYLPGSNPLAFTIAGVSNWPAPPQHVSVPQCPSNPYSCLNAQDKAKAANQAADQAYEQQAAGVQAKLAAVQEATGQESAKVRALRPGTDKVSTSVYGVLNLASARFKSVSGEKWLIIASDMGNNSRLDEVPPDLTGVRIIIELFCTSAVACSHTEASWNSVFHRAHAASISWLEPEQAQTASSPWGRSDDH